MLQNDTGKHFFSPHTNIGRKKKQNFSVSFTADETRCVGAFSAVRALEKGLAQPVIILE